MGTNFLQFCHIQGLFWGAFGPTLLDLQLVTHTTTTEIGLMFTVMTVGAMCGAIIGGQILDRVNYRIYLALVLLIFGSLVIILPWANSFSTLMCIAAVLGLFEGAIDCGEYFYDPRVVSNRYSYSENNFFAQKPF